MPEQLEAERDVLERLLTEKFGPLPQSIRRKVNDAEAEDIRRWTIRLLSATKIDDVFV